MPRATFSPKGLDLLVTANYNRNVTHNIDTAARYYNWYGHYYEKNSRGEQSYQNSESRNTNWNATLTLNYRIGEIHTLTFNMSSAISAARAVRTSAPRRCSRISRFPNSRARTSAGSPTG